MPTKPRITKREVKRINMIRKSRTSMLRRSISALATCVLLLYVLAADGRAQVNTASLTGLVSDPTGAAVAGALITAKNVGTNLASSVTTDASGYYVFGSLSVGNYTLTVELQGFKKLVHENIALEVGQKARVDF